MPPLPSKRAARSLHRVFIGLGSNVGNRERQLHCAINWLQSHDDIAVLRATDFIETEPWGVTNQPAFVNAVVEIETPLSPHELLFALKDAEKALGRVPSSVRWGPREIDLDILLFDNVILNSSSLVVPHAQLVHRPFILKHLVELDPMLRDPRTGTLFSDFL